MTALSTYADGTAVREGDHVVIHRWMFDEVSGVVEFHEASQNDPENDDWVIGIVEDQNNVFGVRDVIEANHRPILGGGAW
jgi:hypothetical protein